MKPRLEPTREPGSHDGVAVSSSVLLAFVAKFSLGPAALEGSVLRLGPLVLAGWLGLMVTAPNLLPIGHITHANFGRRTGDTIRSVALVDVGAVRLAGATTLVSHRFLKH